MKVDTANMVMNRIKLDFSEQYKVREYFLKTQNTK